MQAGYPAEESDDDDESPEKKRLKALKGKLLRIHSTSSSDGFGPDEETR